MRAPNPLSLRSEERVLKVAPHLDPPPAAQGEGTFFARVTAR